MAEPKGKRKEQTIDKIKIAVAVAEQPANLDSLDLKQKIDGVVKFIRKVNS